MPVPACYLDCHEARLCYLVIHIENLLRPLHLFYLHLWPIYWLFLVGPDTMSCLVASSKLLHLPSSVHCSSSWLLFEDNRQNKPTQRNLNMCRCENLMSRSSRV
jgi:hypothetical protein